MKIVSLISFTFLLFCFQNDKAMDLSAYLAPKANDMTRNALEQTGNNKNANAVMRPDEKHASSNLHSSVDVKSSVQQTVECTVTNGNTVVSIVCINSITTQNPRDAKKEEQSPFRV